MESTLEKPLWIFAGLTLALLLAVFNYVVTPQWILAVHITCYGLIGLYLLQIIELMWRHQRQFVQSQDFLIKLVIAGTIAIIYRQPTLAAGLIILEEAVRLFGQVTRMATTQHFFERMQTQPALLVTSSFAMMIAVGSVLLSLPIATVGGKIAFLDAIFTATSATCVTGLIVQDTGTYFTHFGQGVILALIQIGALGIMTMSTSLALVVGRRLSVRERTSLQETMATDDIDAFRHILRNIIRMTLAAELLGGTILAIRWHREFHDWGQSLYYGMFHAISAFCNAGFGLLPDSLIQYQSDPTINLTVTLLIILGGLGFTVLYGIVGYYRMTLPRTLNIHVKLTLVVTGVLLMGGTLFIFFTEYSGALLHLPLHEKIWVSWFQSVTLRTAGFNTIDVRTFSSATLFLCCIWMFIGASPGSTGGGIKTTTLGVLIVTIRAMLTGREQVEVFGRTIPRSIVRKSTSIFLLSVGILVVGLTCLLLSQPEPLQPLLFEAVSAVGTVGLSLGVTSQLTPMGKIVIISMMYMGRIGPLTVAFVMGHTRSTKRYRLPQDKVMVG